MKSLALIIAVIGLQACAPTGDQKLQQVQARYPDISNIDPMDQVTVTETSLKCAGSCTITFKTNVVLGGSVTCGGSLTVSNNTLVCTNNLEISN